MERFSAALVKAKHFGALLELEQVLSLIFFRLGLVSEEIDLLRGFALF